MSGEECDGCCDGLLTWAGMLEGGRMERDNGEFAAGWLPVAEWVR